MAAILQEDWNADLSLAWAEAYAAITEIMLDGMEYPDEILEVDTATAI